jgi:hypothetical protein
MLCIKPKFNGHNGKIVVIDGFKDWCNLPFIHGVIDCTHIHIQKFNGAFVVNCTILTSPKPTTYNFKQGVITIKKTISNKVKKFTKNYNIHVAYTYWFIKYQNYV